MIIFASKPVRCFLAAIFLASTVSAFAAERVDIVSEGDLATKWVATPDRSAAVPGYPETFTDKSEDACVAIGYQINKDGSTSDYTLLKSWGSRTKDNSRGKSHLVPLSQTAVATIQQWRFAPAAGTPSPVFTASSFAFSAVPAADRNAIRGHCLIDDLPAFIAKAQADAYKRGNIQKGRLDRDRVDNPPNPYAR